MHNCTLITSFRRLKQAYQQQNRHGCAYPANSYTLLELPQALTTLESNEKQGFLVNEQILMRGPREVYKQFQKSACNSVEM